jgi:D-arabinose 5-phosphate isomerase GutQ
MHQERLANYFSITEKETKQIIDKTSNEALEAASELIKEAQKLGGRVHVTGIGKPGHVAHYIASLYSSIGTPTYFLDGTEAIHGSSGQVEAGDVVIALSNSGETEELKKTVQTLKNNEAVIIGVSGREHSWLAEQSEVFLFAGVEEEGDTLNKPPRASILAEIIVLQALSILLQEENQLDPEMYYKWHPGGSLGAAIKGSVKG